MTGSLAWGVNFCRETSRCLAGPSVRSFEKGLEDRGGWNREILQKTEIQASFLYHFSYAPFGEGGHISGELFGSFWGFVCRQPLPFGRGVCETKSKNGRSRPRKPFISRVFCAQRGIETMVSNHGLGRGQTMG